ncbi:hypothetical protein AVEN_165478-1 [Araneus ventricosus]|uniref:Uncharacterized protein n=1 Tax=Araneus ventricosus TaxID=182803 RepID=A0A4Y2UEY5_ARAVE|nr:hypothetical protein AVEN_165478-1 [Araneus ventricosus]
MQRIFERMPQRFSKIGHLVCLNLHSNLDFHILNLLRSLEKVFQKFCRQRQRDNLGFGPRTGRKLPRDPISPKIHPVCSPGELKTSQRGSNILMFVGYRSLE